MTKDQLHQDIKFLAERQLKAGSFSMRVDRDTGISSNSIVAMLLTDEAKVSCLKH